MAAVDGRETAELLQEQGAPAAMRISEDTQLAALQRQVLQLRRLVAGSLLVSTVSMVVVAALLVPGRNSGGNASGHADVGSPLIQHAALSLPGPVGMGRAVGEGVSAQSLGLAGPPASHPALLQRWTGPDNVIVPYGFTGCDTSAMPPQIAPVRRAGDFLFLSGILGYKNVCQDAEPDPDKQIELAFHWADVALQAAGSDWGETMAVTSYHLSVKEHTKTFEAMRAKYLPKPPFPAWTAVAVNELYFTNEIYEMTIIALRKPCTGLECDR